LHPNSASFSGPGKCILLIYRVRPPLEYIKPENNPNYKNKEYRPLVDKHLPPFEELFEDVAMEDHEAAELKNKKEHVSQSGVRMLK
jgi:hypothetical protein